MSVAVSSVAGHLGLSFLNNPTVKYAMNGLFPTINGKRYNMLGSKFISRVIIPGTGDGRLTKTVIDDPYVLKLMETGEYWKMFK